jgi:hypothetical protein
MRKRVNIYGTRSPPLCAKSDSHSSCSAVLAPTIPVSDFRADQETKTRDDSARRQAPGKFIRLHYGLIHYESLGDPGQRTPVFVNGFSVAYYLGI